MDYKRTLVTLALLAFWVIACGSHIGFGADDPPKGGSVAATIPRIMR